MKVHITHSVAGWLRCGLSSDKVERVDGEAGASCRPCIRAFRRDAETATFLAGGPLPSHHEQFDRQRAKAKDRRDAEKVVLARHADELEDELALRALARMGS